MELNISVRALERDPGFKATESRCLKMVIGIWGTGSDLAFVLLVTINGCAEG